MKKPVIVNSLEDLGAALRRREARNNPGKAIITRTTDGRKPYKDNPGLNRTAVAAATSNDGVVWFDEASQITEEQYAELSKRPKPLGVWINHGSGSDWPADILKDDTATP